MVSYQKPSLLFCPSEQGLFIFIKKLVIDLKQVESVQQSVINNGISFQFRIKLRHSAQLQQFLGFIHRRLQPISQAQQTIP